MSDPEPIIHVRELDFYYGTSLALSKINLEI